MISKLFILTCVLCSISCAEIPRDDDTIFGNQLSPRTAGRSDAADGQFPYQCSLQLPTENFCGCAIISSDWVITAARCIWRKQPQDVDVVVGTNQWKSNGIRHKSLKFVLNEDYIELIQVQEKFEFNEKVQPIKYSREVVPRFVPLQVSGWGRADGANGPRVENLQVFNVKSIADTTCGARETELCAADEKGGLCFDAAGSPLVRDNELVGIAIGISGLICAKDYPDTYIRVSYFYDWIQEKIISS